jgi:response regulator RpfG family c-di-GMP phosphodiesterase
MSYDDLNAVVVDDYEESLFFIEELTKILGFQVRSFLCPLEALSYLKEHQVDMVFTDFRMPKMDGLSLIRETRKLHRDVPIVMISGELEAPEFKEQSLQDGCSEFFFKPFSSQDFFERVKPLAEFRRYVKFVGMYRMKEDQFGNHRIRVGHYAKILAAGLNLDKNEQYLIYYGAQLHDIGMNSIPDHILFKAESLTREETELVKRHTSIGHIMLQAYENPYLMTASNISLTHHERFNGAGYPAGLSGDSIPLAGRITAIADVFDVLTSVRPYKAAWDFEKSIRFMSDNSDRHFDPGIVDVLAGNADRMEEVYASLSDCRYEAITQR